MSNPVLPELIPITPSQIDDLLWDLNFQKNGGNIYYVVDPHEIYDYCFPVKPAENAQIDFNNLADSQITLFHIFNNSSNSPIVPHEYLKECKGILKALNKQANKTFENIDLINHLTSSFDESRILEYDENDFTEAREILYNNFGEILSVVMGLFSIGTERFSQVLSSKIHQGLPDFKNGNLNLILSDLKPGPISNLIFESLKREIDIKSLSSEDKNNRMKTNYSDACVIDKIITINLILNEAYEAKVLKKPTILLYFSSALKSINLFSNPSLVALSCKFGPKSLLRTQVQLFAKVVTLRPDNNHESRIDELSKIKYSLQSFEELREKFRTPGVACSPCHLKGGVPYGCDFQKLCEAVKQQNLFLTKKRKELNNLGLLGNLDEYTHYFKLKERVKKFEKYFDIWKSLNDNNEIKDFALQKGQILNQIYIAKNRTIIQAPLAIEASNASKEIFIERDVVTAVSQSLPLYCNIISDEYKSIWNVILKFYRSPVIEICNKHQHLQEALTSFIKKDSSDSEDGDHELIRCLLYLCIPDKSWDVLAFEHSLAMAKVYPNKALEFFYIAAWAGRRACYFVETDKQIKVALSLYPNDPRLHHGMSLNIFSWLSFSYSENCPYHLDDAIAYSSTAVKLYKSLTSKIYSEAIGANYNNLCYFHSFDTKDFSFDLVKARSYLELLKLTLPRNDWKPFYPEYYHTEANLEFQEFVRDKDKIGKKQLLNKLGNAKNVIKDAVEYNPYKKLYSDLYSKIDRHLSELYLNT